MDKFVIKFLLFLCCKYWGAAGRGKGKRLLREILTVISLCFFLLGGCLLLPQSAYTLRIKRADIHPNATDSVALKTEATAAADPAVAASDTAVAVVEKPKEQQHPELTKSTAVAAVAAAVGGTAAKVIDNAATVDAAVTIAPAAHVAASLDVSDKKLEKLLPLELADRMHRSKRRMSIVDDGLFSRSQPNRHGRHHSLMGGANPMAAPPFVYYNKMVSPDGKQELKEFQLLGPNMVIESMQHDMNYGPEIGSVVLLNADNGGLNGHLHGLGKQKHGHAHKHKPSAMALPPFLYMLQQMLQPNLNIDLEPPQAPQHSRTDVPFFQLLDSAVDTALRSNPGLLDHLLNDNDLLEKEKDKDHDGGDVNESLQSLKLEGKDKLKESSIDLLANNHKEDELLVSCPIHHERHANNNGEIIDDDVVLVNECHIV